MEREQDHPLNTREFTARWHDIVEEWLRGKTRVTGPDVYKGAIGGEISRLEGRIGTRIKGILLALGCVQKKSNGKWFWLVPEHYSAQLRVAGGAAQPPSASSDKPSEGADVPSLPFQVPASRLVVKKQ